MDNNISTNGTASTVSNTVLQYSSDIAAKIDAWLATSGDKTCRIRVYDADNITLAGRNGKVKTLEGTNVAKDVAHYIVSLRKDNDPRVTGDNVYIYRYARHNLIDIVGEDVFAGVKGDSANTTTATLYKSIADAVNDMISRTNGAKTEDAVKDVDAAIAALQARRSALVPPPAPVFKTTEETVKDAENAVKDAEDALTAAKTALDVAQAKLANEVREAKLAAMIAEEEAQLRAEAKRRAEAKLAEEEAKQNGPRTVKPGAHK